MAASGGTGTPYQVYNVINVGDPDVAQTEVDALAGTGSEVGKMTKKFVQGAAIIGNFPPFRVVLIPFAETHFGPSNEAITAVKFIRSDLFVSCYPTEDSTNRTTLQALVALLNGVDRDLNGQFGSFAIYASLEDLQTQLAFNVNDRTAIAVPLPDSNTALVPIMGTVTSASPIITAITQPALTPTADTTSGSPDLTNVSDTDGIYPGAAITGVGIPVNTTIRSISGTTIVMSANATATASTESVSIVNLPTAGIYPGAQLSGTGIPANTTVQSVAAATLTMTQNASSTHSSEAISAQNVISQSSAEVASANAGGMAALSFPYVPLQGVICGGLIPPRKSSDWIVVDPAGASEAALQAGLAPLVISAGATVLFLRTRTTWVTQADNVTPVTAYFDWQPLNILNDFKETCFLVAQNPPFNNNPGGTKASAQVAALFKDEVLREAQSYEDQGAFQGVKTLAPQFIVAPSTSSRGRFDFKIPVNVLPDLYVIAGNIQATTVGDFTL